MGERPTDNIADCWPLHLSVFSGPCARQADLLMLVLMDTFRVNE